MHGALDDPVALYFAFLAFLFRNIEDFRCQSIVRLTGWSDYLLNPEVNTGPSDKVSCTIRLHHAAHNVGAARNENRSAAACCADVFRK